MLKPMEIEYGPLQTYYLILSSDLIKNRWYEIRNDVDNPRKDIETPEEWIAAAKNKEFKVLGAEVVIQDEPPKWSGKPGKIITMDMIKDAIKELYAKRNNG